MISETELSKKFILKVPLHQNNLTRLIKITGLLEINIAYIKLFH